MLLGPHLAALSYVGIAPAPERAPSTHRDCHRGANQSESQPAIKRPERYAHGTLLVTHGKTSAARRLLPMTPRVRLILEGFWERSGKPAEGWIWPALTRSGHIEASSLRKQHSAAFVTVANEAANNQKKGVRPFVLYSLRHTFLTRLGESGCDAWTLARIAGHSSIADLCPLRPPVRGCCFCCHVSARWAQNWAQ